MKWMNLPQTQLRLLGVDYGIRATNGHAAQKRDLHGPTRTTAVRRVFSPSQVFEQNGLPGHLKRVTHDAESKSSELLIHITVVSVRLFE
jgi:hypothetical protein